MPGPFPLEIERLDERRLKIRWSDGHEGFYTYNGLRRGCPCVLCENERERSGREPLRVLQGPVVEEVKPLSIKPVGRYAIAFEWSDGHTTGIYSYEYLRSLCECDECKR